MKILKKLVFRRGSAGDSIRKVHVLRHRISVFAHATILFLVLPAIFLRAQDVTVTATVDSTRYMIGEWIVTDVRVHAPKEYRVQLPESGADFEHADFISSDRNTVTEAGADRVYDRRYTIIVFDTGRVDVRVLVKYFKPDDTTAHVVKSEPLQLDIGTVELDTTITFRDIKDVLHVPLTIWDYLLYAGMILAVAALGYIGYRWYRKRPAPVAPVVREPEKTAYEKAVERLRDLEARNLWQQGGHKEYQSELTEILREYIEFGFGVPALEQVTSEIIGGVALLGFDPALITRFEQILRLADRTKFAKYVPQPGEHHEALKFAYEFLERTRPVQSPASEEKLADV